MTEQIKLKERLAECGENEKKSELYGVGVLVLTQKAPILKNRPIGYVASEICKEHKESET